MAIGDDAATAGMQTVPGTLPANEIDTEINRSRDYIAQRTSAITPVEKGGTGATTAAAARTNLGTHDAANLTDGTITRPINTGGTITANGNIISNSAVACLGGMNAGNGLGIGGTIYGIDAAGYGTFSGINTGDILAGHIFSPAGRASPVSTSYVSAYFNSDGRLGADPSAERFKQDIAPYTYTLEQLAAIQIVAYRLRSAVDELGDDADTLVGVIAEQLIAVGLPEFVNLDEHGQPFNVAYERLAVAAIGALHDVAARLDKLGDRLAALETGNG